jgi:hypothetical protein
LAGTANALARDIEQINRPESGTPGTKSSGILRKIRTH